MFLQLHNDVQSFDSYQKGQCYIVYAVYTLHYITCITIALILPKSAWLYLLSLAFSACVEFESTSLHVNAHKNQQRKCTNSVAAVLRECWFTQAGKKRFSHTYTMHHRCGSGSSAASRVYIYKPSESRKSALIWICALLYGAPLLTSRILSPVNRDGN